MSRLHSFFPRPILQPHPEVQQISQCARQFLLQRPECYSNNSVRKPGPMCQGSRGHQSRSISIPIAVFPTIPREDKLPTRPRKLHRRRRDSTHMTAFTAPGELETKGKTRFSNAAGLNGGSDRRMRDALNRSRCCESEYQQTY